MKYIKRFSRSYKLIRNINIWIYIIFFCHLKMHSKNVLFDEALSQVKAKTYYSFDSLMLTAFQNKGEIWNAVASEVAKLVNLNLNGFKILWSQKR